MRSRPYNRPMPDRGVILFAHGARDPRWSEPFERLAGRLAQLAPDVAISLAFLEFMTPNLADAARALVEDGCRTVTIVPVFLGVGGHVRRDVPALVERIAAEHPRVDVRVAGSVGDDDVVLDAIAGVCLSAARA